MGVSEWIQTQLNSTPDSGDSKSKRGLHRDFTVNRAIAEACLDKISLALGQRKLQTKLKDILILAISLARKTNNLEENKPSCVSQDARSQDRRGIVRFVEIGEQNLAYLFAEAIDELGARGITNFAEVVSLWEEWADQGLQILYCDYFSKYFSSTPRHFFDLLLESRPNNSEFDK